MTYQPTERELTILTAWWVAKGSGSRASRLLGIQQQSVRNALYQFRRYEHVETSFDLAVRYMDEIQARKWALVGRAA